MSTKTDKSEEVKVLTPQETLTKLRKELQDCNFATAIFTVLTVVSIAMIGMLFILLTEDQLLVYSLGVGYFGLLLGFSISEVCSRLPKKVVQTQAKMMKLLANNPGLDVEDVKTVEVSEDDETVEED